MLNAGPGALIPISSSQRSLWFLSQIEEASRSYHINLNLQFDGDLNVAALHSSLNAILARHDSLRTTFVLVGGLPHQRVTPAGERQFTLVHHDIRDNEEPSSELQRLMFLEATTPFNLEEGPLIRGILVRTDRRRYVLAISVHHIVADGWSMGLLQNELSRLYGELAHGWRAELQTLNCQYSDFTHWQLNAIAEGSMLDQVEFWKRTLAGAPSFLNLPTDMPRLREVSYTGRVLRFDLDIVLVERIRSFCSKRQLTIFTLLLAGWAILLSLFSGQEDIVIGTPASNRTKLEYESVIGLFANTLPLRLAVRPDQGISAFLAHVRQVTLFAQHNQDLPFAEIIDAVKPQRDITYHPMFQVMFAWQNAPREDVRLPGMSVSQLPGSDPGVSRFDFLLSLKEKGSHIEGVLEYAAPLFDEPTAVRYIETFKGIVEQITARIGDQVGNINALSRRDQRNLHTEWNATVTPFVGAVSIHHRFLEAVQRWPDNVALTFDGVHYTYRRLADLVDDIAQQLECHHIALDEPVGVCATRGVLQVVATLAILKVGGAFLPLDPNYPASRLQFMIRDSGIRLVLTTEPAQVQTLDENIAVLPLSSIEANAERRTQANAAASAFPMNLAYVIYTSGSTGQPKAVQIAHKSVLNLATAQAIEFGIHPGSRVLQFASLSFDAAVSELFTTLLTGATLILASQEALLPGPPLQALLSNERISVVTLPPSVLAVLDPIGLPYLTTVVSAGEALPSSVMSKWAVPPRKLLNAYGPSETTVCASMGTCMAGDLTSNIGRPMANTRLYVVNRSQELQPIGVPGELLIGGVGVGRGYRANPRLTAEKYIPDPFSALGERLYRTGDRVRWRNDGTLEFLGREDRQIKLRGFRIELTEIERVLNSMNDVFGAVSILHGEASGSSNLVAYAVSKTAGQELRERLRLLLPEHMIPGIVCAVSQIPLTANGKIDVHALPDPYTSQSRSVEMPSTAIQEVVADLWKDVLGLSKLGLKENFFELGGNSLHLHRVYAKLSQINSNIRVVDLFRYSTVEQLARFLEQGHRADESLLSDSRTRGHHRAAALRSKGIAR
ncbi:MAG: hypothetical protein JWM43_3148 [Acidobacteriaceae bacterium]|nr:hypothetical protein [Acidobacteriaceae bacterium]